MAVAASALLPGVALAEPSVAETADAYFRRGVELAKVGDFGAAVREFESAQALSPHPSVLYNLGQAYSRSGQPVAALRALREYLAQAQGVDAARRRQVQTLIATNEGRIGWVIVTTPSPTVRVLIDGREPSFDANGRIPLAVGSHSLVSSAPGYEASSLDFSVEPGATVELEPTLRAARAVVPGWLAPSCGVPDVAVMLDGRALGLTPIEPLSVVPGPHTVTFTRLGYTVEHVPVVISESAMAHVSCRLRREPHTSLTGGKLLLPNAPPSSARVNGVAYDGGFLPPGRHWVSLELGEEQLEPRLIDLLPGTVLTLAPRIPVSPRAVDSRDPWFYGLTIGGGAVFLAGVTGYLLNAAAFNAWHTRKQTWAGNVPEQPDSRWLAEGEDLDADLDAIQRVDLLAVALGATGAAMAATGVLLKLTADAPGDSAQATLELRATGAKFRAAW